MIRFISIAVLWASLLSTTVFAAPIQLIDGLPGAYQPGESVSFDVRLPAISNLGSYNIDLVLESAMGVAGVDFFFDVAATAPASVNYVFPSTASFFDAANVDSPTRHRITLTDFDFSGVNVLAGTNDRIATVAFQTISTFNGQLALFVDAPALVLDTPEVVPTPVPGFEMLQTDIAAAERFDMTPVPEPASLAGMIAGFVLTLACCGRNRLLAD